MYRTYDNKIFILEYFCNGGDLNGAEIMRQLNSVITYLEMVDCKVFGICCDAGGANARLYKYLQLNMSVSIIQLVLIALYICFTVWLIF